MDRFHFLPTGQGNALVWAANGQETPAPTPAAPAPPGEWRACALADARDRAGVRLTPALDGPLTAVTWVDAGAVPPEAWPEVVAALQALPGEPLVRAELEPEAAGALLPALAGRLEGEDAPAWLHLPLHGHPGLPADALEAAEALVGQGVPVAAEVRLLRGRTDDAEGLRELCHGLLARRVRPQALIAADWLPDGLRVAAPEALELVQELRGWISGAAAPQVVRERRDGSREVCVPDYVTAVGPAGVTVRNYRGESYRYADPPADGD